MNKLFGLEHVGVTKPTSSLTGILASWGLGDLKDFRHWRSKGILQIRTCSALVDLVATVAPKVSTDPRSVSEHGVQVTCGQSEKMNQAKMRLLE